jgi:predicted permease
MIESGRRLVHRFSAFLSKPPLDAELEAEIAAHIEMATAENIERGLTPLEARRQALVRFGGIDLAKYQQREARGLMRFDILLQDFRYTVRTLSRDRGFTIVAILILALGIGANIAVFSVVNTLLLRPLPFPNSQQLVWLTSGVKLDPAVRRAAGLSGVTFTVSAYEEFQRHNHSFENVTSYNPFFGNSEYTMTGRSEPLSITGVMVAGNFFQTLQVQPVLGRLFVPEELHKGGRPAVLLGNSFWRQKFGADPAIIGQTITLNKRAVTVVGVLPSSFDFGSVFSPGMNVDLYTPAVMDDIRDWGNTLAIVGRLKPGVSVAQAQTEADLLFPQLKSAHPDWQMDYSSTLVGLKDFVSGKLRRSLIALWCAVGLVMLIVCVNLSSLMVARTAARRKEFAMRMALGAGRGRLIRQSLIESVVLSCSGALLGLGLAFGLTFYLAHQNSVALPLLHDVKVDTAVLLWTSLFTTAVALLFGIVPGLTLSGRNLQNSLKDGARGSSGGGRRNRLRSALVISEVALACILLTGAGLLLRSFLSALDVDMGFQPSRVSVIKLSYEDGNDRAKRGTVLQDILLRINSIPGIEASGVADMLPLGRTRSWQFAAKDNSGAKRPLDAALVRVVTPGYLGVMGMHLSEGRDLSWQDSPKARPVVIVNQSAARHFWPGENALGKIATVNDVDSLVIGVLADVRETTLEDDAGPEAYLPFMQTDPEGAELVVKSKLPTASISPSVLGTLRSINSAQPAYELQPFQKIVDHAVSPRRFFLVLVTFFAALGLILAALGIYGVISYSVAQRTQEIGIRMALGASAGRVRTDVLRRTMLLAFAGVAIGTAASLSMAHLIASMLFATSPWDSTTYVCMVLALGAVALVSGYIPARRASRIDPMVALRTE